MESTWSFWETKKLGWIPGEIVGARTGSNGAQEPKRAGCWGKSRSWEGTLRPFLSSVQLADCGLLRVLLGWKSRTVGKYPQAQVGLSARACSLTLQGWVITSQGKKAMPGAEVQEALPEGQAVKSWQGNKTPKEFNIYWTLKPIPHGE